ncbi:MAG: SMI1/KNR4 family protein [Pseudomonadota bacterium]
MNELNRINTALTEVGRRYGILALYLSPDGTCAIKLKDGTNLFFEWVEHAEKFFVYTSLITLPNDKGLRLAVYETLALLNCLSLHHGTLAAHGPTSLVLYQIVLDTAGLNADQIDNAMSNLLEERPALLARIEEALTQGAAEKTAASSSASASGTTSGNSAATKEAPWVEAFDGLQKTGARSRHLACSEREIVSVEADCGDRLPAQYRQFLARAGRGAELLFSGEDIFFPNLLSFNQRAIDILRTDGGRFVLPKDAFVFLIHREVQFLFFHLGTGDDPPIYSYSFEEGPNGFVKAYKSFSEFMRLQISMFANNHQTLARLNAPNIANRT